MILNEILPYYSSFLLTGALPGLTGVTALTESLRIFLGNQIYGINTTEKDGIEAARKYLSDVGELTAINSGLTALGLTLPKLYRMIRDARKFGKINYVGFYSLWYRECSRFFIVWAQTLLSPLVSSLLFLVVLSLALGNDRNDVLGYSFIIFLAPGLIIQSMILQSFSHSVS